MSASRRSCRRIAGCMAVIGACLFAGAAATTAAAGQFRFRGDLVKTYLAEAGFLDRLPPGTRLNCEDGLCSGTKAVRIYVFRNGETTKSFWSTDYCDVMFDEAEVISGCGENGHVAYYDENDQLLYKQQLCPEIQRGAANRNLLSPILAATSAGF